MKPKTISVLSVFVFYVWALSPRLSASVTIPPRVLFAGVLVPGEEHSRNGQLGNFQVLIGKHSSWTFLLDKMETIGSVGLNRVILQKLFPPILRIVGPDEVIERLNSPEAAGKMVSIEGLLYTGSRTLYVIQLLFNGSTPARKKHCVQ